MPSLPLSLRVWLGVCVTVGVLLPLSGTISAEPPGVVKLERQPSSVKVTIDGEVFTVYRFAADLPKPYFLPVTSAGSWDLLAKATVGDDTVAGKRAVVCTETDSFGPTLGLGSVVEVTEVSGDSVKIKEIQEPLSKADLAPLAGTVTRLVNLNPPSIKDSKDPRYYDHPHHKGVWLTVDEVNGINYWNEDGKVVMHSVELLKPEGNPAVFKVVNHWLKPDGSPLIEETSVISLFADRFLSQDVTFKAVSEPVTFEDTKEGMFAIRLPNSMREYISQGLVLNAERKTGTANCWGLESNWVDYQGRIDGQLLGVTVMDHPANSRKSRYHVRDYGLFAINPFGPHAYSKQAVPEAPLTMKPGDEGLRFRYGLFVHYGILEEEASVLEARHARFVQDVP